MTLDSEEFLAVAVQVVTGKAPLEQLSAPLSKLRAQLDDWHRRLAAWPSQPELSEQAQSLLHKALARLEGALDQVETDDPEGLPVSLQAAEDALGTLQGLQQGYAEAVYRGPTFHPYLNRLLLHMGYFFRGGQHTEATCSLLESLHDFLEKLEGEPKLVEALAQSCAGFHEWLGSGDLPQLEEIQLRLLSTSDDLARWLAAQLERDLAGSPSLWAPANIVILAGQQWLAGQTDASALVESIEVCRGILQREFPESPAEISQVLDRLAENPGCLPQEVENLRCCGDALVVALNAQEGSLDVLHQEGLGGRQSLPPLLTGLIQLGEDFLQNPTVADPLRQGLLRLDELIARTEDCLAPENAEQAEALTDTLLGLQTLSQQLKALLAGGQADDLEAARQSSQLVGTRLQQLNRN